jgi:hypothetical protein
MRVKLEIQKKEHAEMKKEKIATWLLAKAEE